MKAMQSEDVRQLVERYSEADAMRSLYGVSALLLHMSMSGSATKHDEDALELMGYAALIACEVIGSQEVQHGVLGHPVP